MEIIENIKDYGDRRFSYTYKATTGATAKAIFHYTIGGGSLKARYIDEECKSSLLCKFSRIDDYITQAESKGIGQKISGEIKFQCNGFHIYHGGMELGKIKMVMSVKQGREAQHTSLTGMRVYQRTKVYGENF